jgi:tetrahydromethanopterin S-methyltransferase subunit G
LLDEVNEALDQEFGEVEQRAHQIIGQERYL